MKNHVYKTFLLTLLVVVMLIGLFYLPRISVGDTTLRRVNMLSEVQKRDNLGRVVAEVRADSAEGIVEQVLDSAAVKVESAVIVDSLPEGMVGIEDFSLVGREMDKFYSALNSCGSRLVRVAYFGDSFIEGDILTSDLRHLLQSEYGGKGVGWVDIEHIASGFRRTVRLSASGWAAHHSNDSHGKGYRASCAGISGNYFIPAVTGWVKIETQNNVYGKELSEADVATVFYSAGGGLNLTLAINGGEEKVVSGSSAMPSNPAPVYDTMYVPTDSVDEYGDTIMKKVVVKREVQPAVSSAPVDSAILTEKVVGPVRSIELKAHGSSRFYGVAFDGHHGVAVDNFSTRGSDGSFISALPVSTLRQFARVRSYDLIVLHFGLNVASAKVKDYSYYTRRMIMAVNHLKQCFPSASILIVGLGDRDQRGADGGFHTMSGVKELVAYQRKMAADTHVAFWNLYEAMGGDGSMAKMKENKQANLDYTHINFAGGKHLAQLLFDVLMNGKSNYDKR